MEAGIFGQEDILLIQRGKNEKVIREYIQNQLQEDKLADQMSMKEFIDPFTGEPVKEGNGKDPFKG